MSNKTNKQQSAQRVTVAVTTEARSSFIGPEKYGCVEKLFCITQHCQQFIRNCRMPNSRRCRGRGVSSRPVGSVGCTLSWMKRDFCDYTLGPPIRCSSETAILGAKGTHPSEEVCKSQTEPAENGGLAIQSSGRGRCIRSHRDGLYRAIAHSRLKESYF
ncbi:hypothetical protein T01_15159 [Trichinella spiralis]|uniref:Uncharacterized protein n=1 Tax=Trichinella spiralis TaxID=6334 RepID=A0A0V1ATP1_TRISP|nr:hypothetical protein T01_15159 [Trichinella spiralis]